MTGTIPIDPEQLEEWAKDPAAYEAIEALLDELERLVTALDDTINLTGYQLRDVEPSERLAGARERLAAAQSGWTAALERADELLRERGGDA